MKIIIIQDPSGKKYTLDISNNNTILEMKKQYAKDNYYSILFKYDGEILRDNETLNYYGIEEGDIIIASETSRGGGGGHICPYGCGRFIPDNYKGCTELLKDFPNYFDK